MPAGLLLQFAGYGLAEYDKVNGLGLLHHAAGTTEDGNLVVMEVWESRDTQGRFMQERLGRALQEGGISGVPTITWIDLVSNHLPQVPQRRRRSRYDASESEQKYSMR